MKRNEKTIQMLDKLHEIYHSSIKDDFTILTPYENYTNITCIIRSYD